jgi:hypothetical protein
MALCACGCGSETELYTTTDTRIGSVKGEPARFVKGHRMRRRASMDEIIVDILSVLARTQSDEFPNGDTRGSTYFTQGMGKFPRSAVYEVFGDWPTALEYIFPEGVKRRQQKHTIVAEEPCRYPPQEIVCIGPNNCVEIFISEGPHNRLCEKCRNRLDGSDQDDTFGDTYEILLPGMKGVLV